MPEPTHDSLETRPDSPPLAKSGMESQYLLPPPPDPDFGASRWDEQETPVVFPGPPTEMGPLGQVGEFHVQAELGRGAFGVVYRAHDGRLQRTVALKILKPEFASGADRARFEREARAAAAVQHDHVVAIHQVGTVEGFACPFLVMEFVAGGSLADSLQREGHVPPRMAADLVSQAARGLHAAHQRGLVHRDIKPGNLLLEASTGRVRVSDFGLARLVGPEETRLTAPGGVAGTPAYMSPEQVCTPESIDARCDVYALGVVLYECLTGQRPFSGTIHMILRQLLEEEPRPLRQLNEGVPRDLETICLKCLNKDPRGRYSSAGDLADDLDRWLRDEPIVARPAHLFERTTRWARRRPAVAGLLATVALAVVALAVVSLVATWQWQRAATALEKANREKQLREQSQVNALCNAVPGEASAVLADLPAGHPEVRQQLHLLWQQEDVPLKRMRVGLALLPQEPNLVRDDLVAWMLKVDDPAEVLLVRQQLLRCIPSDEVVDQLWQQAEDSDRNRAERFRALVALAAFDPKSHRWPKVSEDAVAELLSANPLRLGGWVTALQPARDALVPALERVFRGGDVAKRLVAAHVLIDYVADRPAVLADLLLDADARQYALLWPKLKPHREKAVAAMRRQLASQPDYWNDPPLAPAWAAVPPGWVREVERADGLFTQRFALCQALPLERLSAVTEGLRPFGYRPVRVRPWISPGALGRTAVPALPDADRVAVVWARDGREWKMASGRTAEQVREDAVRERQTGFIPVDVAGYRVHQAERYAAVFVRARKGEQAVLYAGLPAAQHKTACAGYSKKGFIALTVAGAVGLDGTTHFSGVWGKGPGMAAGWRLEDDGEQAYARKVFAGERLLFDVSVGPAPSGLPGDVDLRVAAGNAAVYRNRALRYALAGRPEQARTYLKEYRKLTPGGQAVALEALVAVYLGDEPGGLKLLESEVRANPWNGQLACEAAAVYAQASRTAAVRQAVWAVSLVSSSDRLGLLAIPPPPPRVPADYLRRALALLRQALGAGYTDLGVLQSDPDLEPLRDDSEFQELLVEAGALRRYWSVWHPHSEVRLEALGLHGLRSEAHLARCRELTAQGYRPVALSLASVPGEHGVAAASVWHRPVLSPADMDRRNRRLASGAATLLHLEQPEEVWPLLVHQPDPTVRSLLVERMASRGVDPRLLVQRLAVEKEASARAALIVALGDYTDKQLPAAVRVPLVQTLLKWYRDDPDAGVHGAIDWLLRPAWDGPEKRPLEWRQADALDRIDRELCRRDPDGNRRWYVNHQGQTLTVVPGPVEFRMGSPPTEPDRDAGERPQKRRIARSFAIQSKPVTVAQFKRFLAERRMVRHAYTKSFSPAPSGPIIAVTWFEAAQYCNWLSEKEGIPPDQWCYPREIKEGMQPYPDYLTRTGYRLPTEAEWEVSCRAGTVTSRYYGSEMELLPRYAWHLSNARERTRPVGQKRPNNLGLFDMHGNVWNWCQDVYRPILGPHPNPTRPGTGGLDDLEDLTSIVDRLDRVLRGGSFVFTAAQVRSAYRNFTRPSNRNDAIGLRVVRTCPGR